MEFSYPEWENPLRVCVMLYFGVRMHAGRVLVVGPMCESVEFVGFESSSRLYDCDSTGFDDGGGLACFSGRPDSPVPLGEAYRGRIYL